MTQQIIDIGAAPNDGQGDNLRTAFDKVNDNFSNVWAQGPVDSNVRIQGNTISTLQVNQDLALSPNGTGNVRLNNNTIPGANNTWFLGSTTNRWRGLYVGNVTAGNISTTSLNVPGDAYIGGNLTVVGNTIQIGNITTDTKTIQLANSATTDSAANGSGITVGANDDIATLLYDSANNVWTTNIGVSVGGPITGTSLAVSDATIYGNIAAINGNFTGNVTGGNLGTAGQVTATGNISGGNLRTVGQVTATGNVTGNYFIGNGSQLTGIETGVTISNTAPALGTGGVWWNSVDGRAYVKYNNQFIDLSPSLVPDPTTYVGNVVFDDMTIENVGNVLPGTSNTYSLGSAGFQWKDLWISNNTIYINSVPVTLGAGNVLTVNGEALLSNDSNTSITTTGNITADYFIGDGSQLSNVASTGNLAITGTTIEIAPDTDGTSINISPDPEGWAYLQLPNNATANAYDTRLWNAAGNVEIGSGDFSNDGPSYTWIFDNDGRLNFPRDATGNTDPYLTITGGAEPRILSEDASQAGPANLEITALYTKFTGSSGEAITIYPDDGEISGDANIQIWTNTVGNTQYSWAFGNDGTMAFPTGGLISNYPGDGPGGANNDSWFVTPENGTGGVSSQDGQQYIQINNDLFVEIGTSYGTANASVWTFGRDGDFGAPGNISTNGNITAGNILVVGSIRPSGVASPAPSLSGFSSVSAVSLTASGNVSGNYILGNGALLTGVASSYGNADVATLLASFGSNTVSTTGNVSAGNVTTTANIQTGGQIQSTAFTGGNISWSASNQTDFQGSIKLGGLGRILSPGGAASIETNNNGANISLLRVTSTAVAANTTSGGLIVSGGAGIAGNAYIGGIANVAGNVNGSGATFSGNVTAQNFTGNINITGNVQGTSPNVTLVAGSYSYVFDNAGALTLPAGSGTGGGDEGGEIAFTQAANSTLSGNTVIVDQYADRIRFFEAGGTNRGAYIDITQAAAGVDTLLNNCVSGVVNAGAFVTMDNLKATVTTSSNRGLSLATVSGTATGYVSSSYSLVVGSPGGAAGSISLTTTPSNSIQGYNFASEGDTAIYVVRDNTSNRVYRITMMIGGSYNNNFISIERLL